MGQYCDYTELITRLESDFSQSNTGILMIELVGISDLDALLGYEIIDDIIGQAITRVTHCLKPNDYCGKFSRYQYAIVLEGLPSSNYAFLAAHKVLRELFMPFTSHQHRLMIAPIIGIATKDDLASSPSELIRLANAALSYAKINRKNIATHKEAKLPSILLEHDLLADLDYAIEESQLYLVLQPQYSYKEKAMSGAEALLRWTHPTQGNISPEGLIMLVERGTMITKLTSWVLSTALRQCSEYRAIGIDAGISINLSAHNLLEPDLVDLVLQNIELWNVPKDKIVLELTETAIMSNEKVAMKALKELKHVGTKLSMDDFGTGYSSIARLVELPIDEIKIDKSFIMAMDKDKSALKIVESMINLGHSLGLEIVAEGVESEQSFKTLAELGCHYAQGYYLSKPLKYEKFITKSWHLP